MVPIGVLVAPYRADPGHPADRPMGRAALALRTQGIDLIFGHHACDGRLSGVRATPDGWEAAADVPIVAAYDRYPSQTHPDAWATLAAELAGVPLANPEAIVLLCRDKVACQHVLQASGLPVPPIEARPGVFAKRLETWGAAFLKPQYGAFGRGVRHVRPGDPLPARGAGAVLGIDEPLFLQRAVTPPTGWSGVSLRVNVQRLPDRSWSVNMPVVRRSRRDPVVNASRGAEVAVGDEVFPQLAGPLRTLAIAAAEALAGTPGGEHIVELGVDVVIDRDTQPWVIEINSRPQGRLGAIAAVDADRWSAHHLEALCRPLVTLRAWHA